MNFFKSKLSILCFSFIILNVNAQSTFPIEQIPKEIIKERGYEEQIKMLVEDCNWENRIEKKVDVFWLQMQNGNNRFGYVYEYILDCDNIRLIKWYENSSEKGQMIDFMIENAEDESNFVVVKRKHLKNQKRYAKYFE